MGFQEVKYIDRPLGKDWSKTWDEVVQKSLKSEHDPLHDLWEYTPPQTPGTEVFCKDNVSGCTTIPATVPDKVFNSMSTLLDDNVYMPQEFSTTLSKNSCLNSNNSSINNVIKSVKPKLVVSELVNYKLEKIPSKGYMLVNQNGKNDKFCKNTIKLTNFKINGQTNISTSAIKNIKLIKSNTSNLSKTKKMKSPVKEGGLKRLSKKANITIPYKKFDFDELLKAKSTKVKKECKMEVDDKDDVAEKPIAYIEVKPECNGEVKIEVKQEIKNEINHEEIACSLDKIEFDELLNQKSTNIISQPNNAIEVFDYDKSNINPIYETELDFDSILGITTASKDSGVGQDMADNKDFDLQLDDLLAGFSDDIMNTNVKSNIDNIDNSDEFKWINALFE